MNERHKTDPLMTQAIAYGNEQLSSMTNYELLSYCFDRLVTEEYERLIRGREYEGNAAATQTYNGTVSP